MNPVRLLACACSAEGRRATQAQHVLVSVPSAHYDCRRTAKTSQRVGEAESTGHETS